MRGLKVSKLILVVLCLLGLVLPVADASADILINDFYDLNDTAAPIEPPPGWTIRSGSGGSRSGTAITAPIGGERFYVYSAVASDEVSIDEHQAWMIEAALSADGIGVPGEAGARMWVTFKDPTLDTLPPPGVNKYRRVEVRLVEDAGGSRRVVLWSKFTAANPAGEEVLSLNVGWQRQPPAYPRYRIRLKRQRIDTGEDYIILQAEASKRPSPSEELWWDDPDSPWADSVPATPDDADPPHRYSQRILVNNLDFETAGTSEIGFGHTNNGTDKDSSIWENIHVTVADDAGTVLPYWPPEPPAPVLTLTTANPPHEVMSQVYLPIDAYLINDVATLFLDTLSGKLSSAPIFDPSAPPAQHIETFTGLDSNQAVTGWAEVADVSGRTTAGPSTQLEIPGQGVETVQCDGFEPPMASGPVTVKKNRVLPLKAQLFDTNGFLVADADILAPPVIQVLFDDYNGEVDPVDVTEDALPAGQGTEGNQFVFTDGEKWQFNLKTKNYSAKGTYTIIMKSGSESEYIIDPVCEASFVIE